MSCPLFAPTEPQRSHDPRDAMLPLGGLWHGLCAADPEHPAPPGDGPLHRHCNLGYARGSCNRFPDDAGPDAARFSLVRDEGDAIRVAWSLERDHFPFASGAAVYSRASGVFSDVGDCAAPPQLRAYVASYLSRKEMER